MYYIPLPYYRPVLAGWRFVVLLVLKRRVVVGHEHAGGAVPVASGSVGLGFVNVITLLLGGYNMLLWVEGSFWLEW